MGWNRSGQAIVAKYMGVPVSGVVTKSRVKYGGSVQHTLRLDHPLNLFGTDRTVVLLDEKELA
jgi:hypothetical protein